MHFNTWSLLHTNFANQQSNLANPILSMDEEREAKQLVYRDMVSKKES